MKINLDTTSGYTVHAYGHGEVTINIPFAEQIAADNNRLPPDNCGKEVLTSSFIITPYALIRDWPPTEFDHLNIAHFNMIAQINPELVLLGMGSRLQFPAPDLTTPLTNQKIGIEFMDTPAACRTYNFLAAEGRHVAAAILIAWPTQSALPETG